MSTNPVDVVAARHKELRCARERITRVAQTLEREREQLATLTARVGAAELTDRQALGASIVAGRAEPPSEAAALRVEIAKQERRVDAVVATLEEAHAAVASVVREHSSAWGREQMRALAKAQAWYEAAISELAAAREAFSDEVSALGWILSPESGQEAPVNALLAGRAGAVNGPAAAQHRHRSPRAPPGLGRGRRLARHTVRPAAGATSRARPPRGAGVVTEAELRLLDEMPERRAVAGGILSFEPAEQRTRSVLE